MSQESRDALARRYASLQRRLLLAEIALGAVFLLVTMWSGASRFLRDFIALPLPAAAALHYTILMLAYGMVSIPLTYHRRLALPRRYGLSRDDLAAWLTATAKESLVAWLLGAGASAAIYFFLSVIPGWWWLAVAGLTAVVSAILSFLAPWLLLPLFFKAEPLPEGELRQRLQGLSAKAGFRSTGIFTLDWSRRGETANAMLLGMGRSRRVVLTDTLLRRYTPEEIETIVAHELGHMRKGHVARLVAFQSSLGLVMFGLGHLVLRAAAGAGGFWGLRSPDDLAGLPLLVLVLLAVGLALAPALLAFSRRLESQADLYCLELTGNSDAFASALSRLHHQNLIEADPRRVTEWLFYDHPPLARRLERVRQFPKGGAGATAP